MSAGSLRRRLILAVFTVTTVVVAASATTLWWSIANARSLAFDQGARDQARDLRPRLEEIAWRHLQDPSLPAEDLGGPLHDGQMLRLIGPEGRCFGRSHDTIEIETLPRHPGPDGVLEETRLPNLGSVRWLVLEIVPRPPPGRTEAPIERRHRSPTQLVLLRPLTPLHHELARQAWILTVVAVTVSTIVGLLVTIIVHRLLRPVRALSEAISATIPGSGEPIAVAGLPSELQPVQARLNDLLARIDQVLERERQSTANIAHELRTPLAGLRARLEVALLRPRDSEHLSAACRQGLANLTLMQGLVDNLLLLARLETGQANLHREAIEVAEVIAAVWSLHQPTAEAQGLTCERRIEPALAITTDAAKLRSILSNLLSNAVAYADAGSAIQIEAGEVGETVWIRVANLGTTIAPTETQRVFERFWRADTVRTVERGHCGLGLPLAQRLTGILGGTIQVEVEDRHFIVNLRLPLE